MSFFSRVVLRTRQDNVTPYTVPLADLLLAVDDQGQTDTNRKDRVYRKWVHLLGPKGERVQVQAVIDGGAMKNTMCMTKWRAQRHHLSELHPSRVTLSVADNRQVASKGTWMGTIDVAGTVTTQSCKVFESNGAFQVILGKPWLRSVQAVHRYDMDEITIQTQGLTRTINNDNTTREESLGHSPRQGDELPNKATDTCAAKHQEQTDDAKKGQKRMVQSAPIQERSA